MGLLELLVEGTTPGTWLEAKVTMPSLPLTRNSLRPEGAPSTVTAVTFYNRSQ